ncbi:AtpZ/AtpI family protein [Roseovarius sp. E0-M6]|uniref:AtpZ/AtpI family protein n=1 Tax=Roseovarius sp. E0-M6 TaxID=3127118 RepID=UPI00300FE62A
MSQGDEKERLAALEARIAALRKPKDEKPHTEEHYSQAHLAWRMVLELVVGLLIGFGIGYGLDRLLGTLPLFLVLFTLLGLAAGIKTMIRSAAEIQRKQLAEEAERMAPGPGNEKTATQDGANGGTKHGD